MTTYALNIIVYFIAFLSIMNATHYMGGEITWECESNGQYVFTVKLYRDCNGVDISNTTLTLDVHNNPNLFSIPTSLLAKTDISPPCGVSGQNLSCGSGGSYSGNGDGSVEEFIYQSSPVTLTGTPGASGWIFSWDGCCRNDAIDNLNLASPPSEGMTLRAVMYSYNGQSADPCYDSSPQFAATASPVLCMGYPFTYNHLATDNDLDSIAYQWAPALDDFSGAYIAGNPVTLTYNNGYSYTSPLPGPNQNSSNIAATLDPLTGEISYTSYTQGNFVTVVKVESWRCGELIAEIYREIQVVMYDCSTNLPPSVTIPMIADTVYAGDLITFSLYATDYDVLSDGSPQTMSIEAFGAQFDTNFTSSTSGCLVPPCATLTPPPPQSGNFALQTDFSWQTDCSHLNYSSGCFNQSNTYTFVINVFDDFCPTPGMNFITYSVTVIAQEIIDAPVMRCAEVNTDGSVTLTWDYPVDADSVFDSYHVYYADSANGTFVAVDSIFNFYQNTTTINNINANQSSGYFYLMSRSGCGGTHYSTSSDTLQSIFLNVTNSNEIALLDWNMHYDNYLSSSSQLYYIYREIPAGIWVLIDSTYSLTYTDSVSVCNDSVSYRVEIKDGLGCTSISSVDGSVFRDVVVPNTPILDSVSVMLDGTTIIGWEQGSSNDIIGYIVYQQVSGVWQPIDTVLGISSTSYNYSTSNASNISEDYRIASLDSCGNTSPMGNIHHTLFIECKLDQCTGSALLTWNNYVNWPDSVAAYNIYYAENYTDTALLTSVSPASSTNEYIHENLTQYAYYCYYVRGVDGSGTLTSSSNIICVYADVPQQPAFVYHNLVTVWGMNDIVVSCIIDTSADVNEYKLVRSEEDENGVYSNIAYISVTPSSDKINYFDDDVSPNEKVYYYQFIAIDTCGNESTKSNIGNSIQLDAIPGIKENFLEWNAYNNWDGNTSHYNIYRKVDDGSYNFINYVNDGDALQYRDRVSELYDSEGLFCYYIEAIEAAGNSYNRQDTSYSNRVCVRQVPKLHIPNTFTPDNDNLNDTFKPLGRYVSSEDYQFIIFSAWGMKVFETTDPSEGWDGTIKGKPVSDDVFVYLVRYKIWDKYIFEEKGTITLVR